MKPLITFFHQAKIEAVAEIILPITNSQCQLSADKTIETIFRIPHAIAQGKQYICSHYPDVKLK